MMNFLKYIFFFNLTFFSGASFAEERPACDRPLEYQLMNIVNTIKLKDDYKALAEIGSKGSEVKSNTISTNVNILARDITLSSWSESSKQVCDRPSPDDVQNLMDYLEKRKLSVGIFDLKAMIEVTLTFEEGVQMRDKRFTQFRPIFSLIKIFFSKEKNQQSGFFNPRKIYLKAYLKYLQEISDFQNLFMKSLNPHVVTWNKLEQVKHSFRSRNQSLKEGDEFSDQMLILMRQIQQMNSTLIIFNPEFIDFARLKYYQDYYRINNKMLVQEIKFIAKKREYLFLDQIVSELFSLQQKK